MKVELMVKKIIQIILQVDVEIAILVVLVRRLP